MKRGLSGASEGLLLALTAFAPLAFGSVEPWSRAIVELLCFALALACFLRGSRAASNAGRLAWLFPAGFAAFAALQAASPLPPDAPRPTLPFTADARETREAALLWAAYAALIWSVPRVIVDHRVARRYCRFLFGLGLCLALEGLLQALTAGGKLYWFRPAPGASSFGPFYNRDHAADLLLMCFAVAIGGVVSARKDFPEVDGPLPSYLAEQGRRAAGAALIFGAFAACLSRGAFAALLLAACALVFLGAGFARTAGERFWRRILPVLAAALVCAGGLASLAAHAGAGAPIESPIAIRLSIWESAWRWWLDAPLFGTGFGGFTAVFPSYQDLSLTGIVPHAHNDWIELALEGGLLAEALAWAGVLLAAAAATRAWRRARSREMRALIAGALAAACAFCAHGFFEFALHIPGVAVVFFGLVGFLLSAESWRDKTGGPRSEAPSVAAAACAAACFAALAWAAIRPAAAALIADWPDDESSRIGALLRAAEFDDAPRFELGVARRLGDEPGPARTALRLNLSRAEQSPFDSDALHAAAERLESLGRRDDAEELYARAASVRFPETRRRERDGDERRERALETLRGLKLLPRELERR